MKSWDVRRLRSNLDTLGMLDIVHPATPQICGLLTHTHKVPHTEAALSHAEANVAQMAVTRQESTCR